jgi:hypothetical protein
MLTFKLDSKVLIILSFNIAFFTRLEFVRTSNKITLCCEVTFGNNAE